MQGEANADIRECKSSHPLVTNHPIRRNLADFRPAAFAQMASENGHSARDHCERSTYARLESVQLNRRHLVSFLAAAVVGAASGSARASLLTGAEGTTGTPVEFPPFELEGSASALRNLASNIDGWRVEWVTGPRMFG